MKKGYKILALFLLGLFAVSFIAGIASAAIDISSLTDSLANLTKSADFADFLTKLINPSILFAVLVFLIVFAVVSTLPFTSGTSEWIRIPLSIVVAILSTAFINPSVYLPLINQYSALGITISFVLPFILLFYFIKNAVPHNQIVQKAIWIVYLVAVIISWISNTGQVTPGGWIVYLIALACSIGMFFWGKSIYAMFWRAELEEAVVTGLQMQKQLMASKIIDLESTLKNMTDLPDGQKKYIREQIKKLREEMKISE